MRSAPTTRRTTRLLRAWMPLEAAGWKLVERACRGAALLSGRLERMVRRFVTSSEGEAPR